MPWIGRTGSTGLVSALGWKPRRRGGGSGYAVRLDWPDPRSGAVSHDFTQFTTSLRRAERCAVATRRFWAPGPLRPLAVTVVPIDRPVFEAHARECASTACPTTAPLLGMDPAGADAAVDRTPS